jgi:hypothetical protein
MSIGVMEVIILAGIFVVGVAVVGGVWILLGERREKK